MLLITNKGSQCMLMWASIYLLLTSSHDIENKMLVKVFANFANIWNLLL